MQPCIGGLWICTIYFMDIQKKPTKGRLYLLAHAHPHPLGAPASGCWAGVAGLIIGGRSTAHKLLYQDMYSQ